MVHQTIGPNTFDVAVVGLGPVGELAGLLLARQGLRVLALERQADVYSLPRVGVLDGEALRTLRKQGCTTAPLPTCSSAPVHSGPRGTARFWQRQCRPEHLRVIRGYQ